MLLSGYGQLLKSQFILISRAALTVSLTVHGCVVNTWQMPPDASVPCPLSVSVHVMQHIGAEGRGSKTALETREAAPWSLSRRVPGEAVMAAPWDQGNRAVPRRSLAAWCDVVCFLFFVFLRAPRVPAEPAEHPTQVMRNPPGTQRRSLLPLDASIV